jgi:hypothetical protein
MTKEDEVAMYERLREAALGSVGGTNGDYGRALLVSRGVAPWLRALASYVPERSEVVRGRDSACVGEVRDRKEAITQVLIGMALQRREVKPC